MMRLWNSKTRESVMAASAALLCLLVYLPALTNGFVNLDDYEYVLNNPLICSLDTASVLRMFDEVHAGFWMPLTWLSLAVDYHMWGLNPFGYHLTNIMLHAINTGLVVLVADSVLKGVRGSTFEDLRSANAGPGTQTAEPGWLYPATLLLVGLLWGIHPLRVESVAWVTERKDVLNGLFALSSVLFYLRSIRNREAKRPFLCAYLLSLVLFACSLMAKSVTVLLPVVLLTLDWYPLDRMRHNGLLQLIKEKIPFFIVSGAVVVMTLYFAHQSGILLSHDSLTFMQRLMISGNAVFEYCRLMLLPTGIMPLHIIDLADMTTYGVKTVAIAAACLPLYRTRQNRPIVATVFCFLLLLLPVLAFFQNGLQAFAARFTYLPVVAPTILACCLWKRTIIRNMDDVRWRRTAFVGAILLIAGCAIVSVRQIGVWKNTETAWSRIIEIKPSGRAYKERGVFRLEKGNYAAAREDLTLSLEFARRVELPEMFNLYAYRGEAFRLQKMYPEAIDDYSRAISMCVYREYFFKRGLALESMGRTAEAAVDFQLAGGTAGTMKWLEKKACGQVK